MKNKKKNRILMLIILLLAVSLGYAILSTTLKINGVSHITKASWNIHWDNVANEKGVTPETAAYIKDSEKTIVEYEIILDKPGDYYEFTVDAVNEGSLDGEITEIVSKVNNKDISTLPSYIKYSVTYSDGSEVSLGDVLLKKNGNTIDRKTYKVKVEFDKSTVTNSDINDMNDNGESYVFNFSVKYSQKVDNQPVGDFSKDPWNSIAENGNEAAKQTTVNNKVCGPYKLGDTRTIKMDLNSDGTDEDYTVRIANCSTPAVCSTNGFSQSACGFVLEFTDVLDIRIMNSITPTGETGPDAYTGGSIGGWEQSEMRQYVNGLINKFPTNLKSKVADTTVVSGHGSRNSSNFTTTDKLYLLSSHEVFDNDTVFTSIDTAYNNTRQLDYYEGVKLSHPVQGASTVKKYNNTNTKWWLRTPRATDGYIYLCLWTDDAQYSDYNSDYSDGLGVSPAFKLK